MKSTKWWVAGAVAAAAIGFAISPGKSVETLVGAVAQALGMLLIVWLFSLLKKPLLALRNTLVPPAPRAHEDEDVAKD